MRSQNSTGSAILQLAKLVYFFIAFLVAISIVFKAISYLHPSFDHGFLRDKAEIFVWYRYFLYIHIFSAPLTIFAGILQFTLNRKTRLHRISGYVYFIAVIFASVSGFVMSFSSIGGKWSVLSFLVLSILWLFFTWKAFTSIKEGNIAEHKVNMTRSFILANSAILLRLFSFFSNAYTDLDPVSAYIVISWLSWLPWIVIYEFIRKIKA